MNKEQVIEKIKKLLAMNGDSAASENEKTIALQHAQRLMAKFSIEIEETNEKPELIVTAPLELTLNNPLPVYLTNHYYLNDLVQVIAQNFGCYCFHEVKTKKLFLMGFKYNIEIATYAVSTLIDQGIKDYRSEYKIHRTPGFGTSFWQGFRAGVERRFLKLSTETGMILYDKVKAKFQEDVSIIHVNLEMSTANGFDSGKQSALDASLNTAVTGNSGKRLN